MASRARADAFPLVGLLLIGACRLSGSAAPLVEFGDALQVEHDVRLEETAEVFNVTPRVAVDPSGGYIVADPSESQIRLYTASGGLRKTFGHKGRGPGEFEHLAAALRSSTGELIAFDMGGRMTVFDSSGSQVVRTEQTPIAPVYHVAMTPAGDAALITGRFQGGGNSSPLVHLFDVRNGRVRRSFFKPRPPRAELAGAYLFTGFSDATIRHDTVAVIFALSDTLYYFDLNNGRLRGKVPLPFNRYRPLRKPMPINPTAPAFRRWVESFTTASHLYWQHDGTVLVQFFDVHENEPQWRLLGIRTDGRPLFEIEDSPKLLGLTANSDSLIFVKLGSATPNMWSIAQVKQ